MIILYINNSLATDAKFKLKSFKTSHTYNNQDDVTVVFYVMVKMLRPDTFSGFSDINRNLETMRMYHFKHDIPKSNL